MSEQSPWWLRALGLSGGLATAIIGVLKVTVGEDSPWGPYIVAGVIGFGVLLVWLIWQRRLR